MTPTSLFFIWGVGVGVGGSIGIHGENGDDTNITIYIFYVFFGGGVGGSRRIPGKIRQDSRTWTNHSDKRQGDPYCKHQSVQFIKPVYAVPQEPREACLKDGTYRNAYVAELGLLSKAVQGSMAIDAWLQRPGSEPLKEVLRPALEGQLADVATSQAMLQRLTQWQTEADMERASGDATAAVLPAAVQVSSRMIAKILI